MASLTQGSALPDVTTTTQEQQTAPTFYTDYLQDIANLGQSAVQQGGVAGLTNLQTQALQMAPDMAFAGSGTLGQASQMLTGAGGTASHEVVGDYMNPYTSAVVDEMGRLTQRNVQENVMPTLGGAAAGTGQFGSRRHQQIAGNTLRDIQADLTGRQYGALSSGYDAATKAAQADLSRQLQAGQGLTTLGQEQYQIGSGGLKQLMDMGGIEQKNAQAALDYPMKSAQDFAGLLKNYNIPLGYQKQTTGPGSQGQYGLSGLAQMGSLASILGSFFKKDGGAVTMADGGGIPDNGGIPDGAAYHDNNGNYYDQNGYLVG